MKAKMHQVFVGNFRALRFFISIGGNAIAFAMWFPSPYAIYISISMIIAWG
jgi:hypothetical protein